MGREVQRWQCLRWQSIVGLWGDLSVSSVWSPWAGVLDVKMKLMVAEDKVGIIPETSYTKC